MQFLMCGLNPKQSRSIKRKAYISSAFFASDAGFGLKKKERKTTPKQHCVNKALIETEL